MMATVCIVGRSGTGKTTFIERLIPELKGRGYRVAVIKHTDKDIELDRPGKDSWRFARAGGDAVVLCTGRRVMANTLVDAGMTFNEALRLLGGHNDLTIVEGFYEMHLPKIEVHRRELGRELLSAKDGLMAVVTDETLDLAAPQFSWDDAKGVADLIVRKLVSSTGELDIGLFVNGEPVVLSPLDTETIRKTLLGMISSLKGVGEVRNVDLWARHRPS